MSSIGQVTRQGNVFKGHLKTRSFRAEIAIVPNPDKKSDKQPDYRVLCGSIDYAELKIMRRGEA